MNLPTNAWRLLIPVTGKAVGLLCQASLLRDPLTFAFVVGTEDDFTGVGRGSRAGTMTLRFTGESLDLD